MPVGLAVPGVPGAVAQRAVALVIYVVLFGALGMEVAAYFGVAPFAALSIWWYQAVVTVCVVLVWVLYTEATIWNFLGGLVR